MADKYLATQNLFAKTKVLYVILPICKMYSWFDVRDSTVQFGLVAKAVPLFTEERAARFQTCQPRKLSPSQNMSSKFWATLSLLENL